MKVFITGMAGFLGSNLADFLLKKGYEVSGCDSLIGGDLDNLPKNVRFQKADCCDYKQMAELIKGNEAVIHTACTPYEGLSHFSPSLVCQNTFQNSASVFSACAETKVLKVINCSSMARYGQQSETPFIETMTPNPIDPYGIAKVASEKLLENLAQTHNFKHITFVPHNIIGPKQKYDDPYRNVASIIINRILQNLPPIIYGDGMQTRSFSDVRDLLPCFENALTENDLDGEIINIGPCGNDITIVELCETIQELMGTSIEPSFYQREFNELKRASCSSDKAKRLLDFNQSYTLKESLEKMISWIRCKGSKAFRYHHTIEIRNKCPKIWLGQEL